MKFPLIFNFTEVTRPSDLGPMIGCVNRGSTVSSYLNASLLFQRVAEFEFPDIFGENKPPEQKQIEDFKKYSVDIIKEKNKSLEKGSIPSWFR
jgi:hypothetical protein